jgi:fumarate hydratase class I
MKSQNTFSLRHLLALAFCVAAIGMVGQMLVFAADESPASNPQFAKWLKPMDWQRDSDDPVIKIGEKGQFDDQHMFAPCVILMGDEFWLYYAGSQDDVIAKGIYKTYTEENLRYSQTAPLNMYDEVDTGTNLPAQIDLMATEGTEYQFRFVTKGGGSANKTSLYQETKALLNPSSLERFLTEKMKSLGTAGCPPYHLVFVIGGTSAEACLKTVKLGTTGYLDHLPTSGNAHGRAFRDVEMEEKMLKAAHKSGYGAQFGGKYFALDVRIIRLPRHGASCPVGMGVSCSADRNIKAKINRHGILA